MTAGTTRRDTLASARNGDAILGLGGADSLTSTHANTTLDGGRGNDSLLSSYKGAASQALAFRQSGGAGDDEAILRLNPARGEIAALSTHQHGGRGHDTLFLQTVLKPGTDLNHVAQSWGGQGNDRITQNLVANHVSTTVHFDQEAHGGSGRDLIYLRASAQKTAKATLSQTSTGGEGNDVLYHSQNVTAPSYKGTIVSTGGDGADSLSARLDIRSDQMSLQIDMQGESGNDSLRANLTMLSKPSGDFSAPANRTTAINLLGGSGEDHLNLGVNVAHSITLHAKLDGGSGADNISSNVEGRGQVFGSIHIDGGSGRSTIWASHGSHENLMTTIITGNFADNVQLVYCANATVNTGGGADRISGSQTHATINAGAGEDFIRFNGAFDQIMSGGSEGDTFVFPVQKSGKMQDFGQDTITDFNTAEDKLIFHGLPDAGAPGRADDIDAATTITQTGTSVRLEFDATGSSITFEGIDRQITSVADLLDDPFSQLL